MEREDRYSVRTLLGRNSFGEHPSLSPGEFRDIINWDLVRNGQGKDEMRTRRGTQFLRPATSPAKWGADDIPRSIPWDVGDEEYDVSQQGDKLVFQALLDPGNPTEIEDFAGDEITLGSADPADMCVRGDRLLVFHPAGNKVVEWNGTTLRARAMGMSPAYIDQIGSNSGGVSGRYVYGIEKVYRVDGADFLVSSPNRKLYLSRELAVIGNLAGRSPIIHLRTEGLDDDDLWTHLRLWRTKNLVADVTDPENVIEPQGIEDELYEVALITRAEIEAGSLTAIATGETLPEGNANVQAGEFAGDYAILDNNSDSSLFNFIGLDRIELVPLPAASVGCFHASRMWVTGVNGKNDILYSNDQGDKYAELYDPLNVIETGRDGVAIKALLSFERDLLFLKESKSGRLQGGDVDQDVEHFDQRVGIAHRTHAEYLPGIGVIALTNDDPALKILGLDYQWKTSLNGMDFSLPIQEDIAAMTRDQVRFLYHRGKIMLSDGAGSLYVFHSRYGKGWTRHVMPIATGNTLNLLSFAGGSRALIVSAEAFSLEIEVEGVTTDDSMEDDTEGNPITAGYTTHMYQADDGKQLVEQEWYWIEARLSAPMSAYPYLNGLPWPSVDEESESEFIISPFTFVQAELKDREYRLYIEPQTIGRTKWVPFAGNFLHYRMETVAPAVIRGQGMRVIVDEDPSSFEAYDPLRLVVGAMQPPRWNSPVLMHLSFDETSGDVAYDSSGNNRHHTWAPGDPAGSHAYDATLVPGGGQSLVAGPGSGYADADWEALDYIGDDDGFNSQSLTYEYIYQFPDLSSEVVIQEGGDSYDFWRLRVNADGSLEYQILTDALSYSFTSAAGVIEEGDDEYTIQFVLSNGGQNGQFYAAKRTEAFAQLLTTRAAL